MSHIIRSIPVLTLFLPLLVLPLTPIVDLTPPLIDSVATSLADPDTLASVHMVDSDLIPLRRLTIVEYDDSSYLDDFAYMAAVPTSVFVYNTTRYISPQLFYYNSDSQKWLLNDWSEYLSPDGGLSQLVIIGDLPLQTARELVKEFQVLPYPWIQGDSSASIAAKLALSEWSSSSIAVFALASDSLPENTVQRGVFTDVLQDVHTTEDTIPITIGSSDTLKEIVFSTSSSVGWIEGSINWTDPTNHYYFTHSLIDPHSYDIDYSMRIQTYWERFYPGLEAPVPLNFWLPSTAAGDWHLKIYPHPPLTGTLLLEFVLKRHPGYTRTISVPEHARSLSVRIDWDNTATDLNLALVDPLGHLVQWAPAGSLLSSPGTEKAVVEYPMAGDWTVVVGWMNANGEQNRVDMSWEIVKLDENIGSYLESAANGAVLASLLNAPLLFVSRTSVPDITLWAAQRLGVSYAFLVDPANIHSATVYNQLDTFFTVANLNTYPLVTQWIRDLSSTEDVVVTVPMGNGEEYFGPATYSAAFHGCPVFSLCDELNHMTTRAEETWYPYRIGPQIDIYITSRYSTRTENGWYDERIPNVYSMRRSVDAFENFLQYRGAYNASVPQQVVLVSPDTLIKVSFDRSLQSHFSVGRIPAEDPRLCAVEINRGALHQFLFRTARSADHALVTMYAYTEAAGFLDNFNKYRTIFQYENTTEILENAGLVIDAHIGYQEVFSALSSQPAVWALSTHGTLTRYPTDPPMRPSGTGLLSLRTADAPYGTESSTLRDANADTIVNPVQFSDEAALHRIEDTLTLEASIEDIGSPIVLLTACLLGGSQLPGMLMAHGATAVIGSPRTVYFHAAAVFSILFLQELCAGNSTGLALSHALAAVSDDYSDPLTNEPRDYANQFVLFGDPSVRLLHPSMPRTVSLNCRETSFGTHTPARGVSDVAALGLSEYLPESLHALDVRFDYYEPSNFTEFVSLLDLRRCVIMEPGTSQSFNGVLKSSPDMLRDYVRRGGVFVILGVAENTSWIPWQATFGMDSSGTEITIVDSTHPLLTVPNNLSATVDFEGHFESIWSNFSVLATDGIYPTVIAATDGLGKVAMTTTHPTGVNRDATIENAVLWRDSPSLVLDYIATNEMIIWGGDRVIVTLYITDDLGHGVGGLTVSVWLNESDVSAFLLEKTTGVYDITLDSTWTSEHIGRHSLRLIAKRQGYDTLTLTLENFIDIRPIPWLLIIAIAIVVVVIMVSYWQYKKRRDEPILPAIFSRSSHRGLSPEERRRLEEEERRRKEEQKKRDREVDIAEYFGVS